MKVKAVRQHLGEGQFPAFLQGAKVALTGEGCSHFLGWFPCEIKGYNTYIPDTFFADGVLTRDYNPTELVVNVGDILEVREIVYTWLLATDENGIMGWIPAETVVSI